MAYEMFKILLVDDDPVVIRLYQKLLAEHHYQVVVARDGEEALAVAFAEQPDIVILDIMLPKLNGYQVCKRLRVAPATGDIPIMMLTALDGTAARQKSYEIGADDFVTKGEPMEGLDGRIKMLIKQRILRHTTSWLAGLGGSVAMQNAYRAHIATHQPLAVCYLDLNGLNAFNEWAGIEQGDRVLWKLAHILKEEVAQQGAGDFIAYIGADDFRLLAAPEHVEVLIGRVVERFDASMREWNGGVDEGHFPTLAVGIVIVRDLENTHPARVNGTGMALLREAKKASGSAVRVAKL